MAQIKIIGDFGKMTETAVDQYGHARYKVYYEVSIVKDREKPHKKSVGTTLLMIGDNALQFEDYVRYRRDSLTHEGAVAGRSSVEVVNKGLSLGKPLVEYSIVIIPSKKKVLHQSYEVAFSTYRYEEELPKLSWQQSTDTKLIRGYLCRKAEVFFSGRYYTAWYAEALPLPYGPYKFGGLPGLILEIEDTNGEFRFAFAGMEKIPDGDVVPIALSRGSRLEVLSRDRVRQITKNFHADPSKVFKGMIVGEDPPKKAIPYNPIELE